MIAKTINRRCVVRAAAAAGVLVIAAASGAAVTTDSWDVHQGSVVTGFWPSAVYAGSDIRDMFGGEFGAIEAGNTIFPDAGWLPGNAVWVTWDTPSVVELNRFVLSVAADGDYPASYNRAIRGFKLYASGDGSAWDLIYDSGSLPTPLGSHVDGMYYYVCDQTLIAPVSSAHFKVEFVCDTTTGPRIVELDGYAAVPEPGSGLITAAGVAGLLLARRRRGRAACR